MATSAMTRCPACGEENPSKFRLCGYCGAPLTPAPALPAQELRKTVTLVFTDLKDSTGLAERLDSEALHEVKERYFGAMSAEIRRHGGKIEKYIGDAILAVFGLPRAHEDDALRAVRAAAGMRSALHEINAGLQARFGVTLSNRTGINTGEVVATGDAAADQKLATGDAVNVAARLQEAAQPGEVLLGAATHRLVRDAISAERVAALTLKGKTHPVDAYRLLGVSGGPGVARRQDAPLVGRAAELQALRGTWQRALGARRAHLMTVIGDAGVGKSRLIQQLVDELGDGARIVSGRCLAYGEGITFWPLRGIVTSAAGIREDDTPDVAQQKLQACAADSSVADRLAAATGLIATQYPLHELAWGARRFLQTLADDKPVLALIEDIHWAEPAFLDLLADLAASVDAPLLVLASGRHELLEERADWSVGERAERLVLAPLDDRASREVVRHLLGELALPDALVQRIVQAAEGNPLYVEQMLSMLVESSAVRGAEGGPAELSTFVVPPTVQALLEARLDRLERAERAAAEPAAVIGLEFPQPAVESLVPAPLRDTVDVKLQALARKQFIRPSASSDSFFHYRFNHHLVRDTVYNGLLKRARASLHTAFVRWADEVNADSERGREFEEILGYHLEQAHRYLAELGPIDDAGAQIGNDGARRLSSAARRALGRGDLDAAVNLFRRASGLLADEHRRAQLAPELAQALLERGEFAEVKQVLSAARTTAERVADVRLTAACELIGKYLSLYGGADENNEQTLHSVQSLTEVLADREADVELALAWRLIALLHGIAGRYRQASDAAQRAIVCARAANNDRLVAKSGGVMANTALLGPTPVPQAIAQCEALLAGGLVDRQVECKVMCMLAQLHAMEGELLRARALYTQARTTLRELGEGLLAASTGIDVAQVELLGGSLAIAETELRADYEFLSEKGETYNLSTIAAFLARVVRDQGRDDEALQFLQVAEQATAEDDFDSQALWRSIRAPIMARAGKIADAETLARSAVDLVRRTEAPLLQADALVELASVLANAGRADEAASAADEAAALYAEKGNIVSAARYRRAAEARQIRTARSGRSEC